MERLNEQIATLMEREEAYANEHALANTQVALNYMKNHLVDVPEEIPMKREYAIHGLSMVWLIIELQLPASADELDLMLASSLLHVFPELKLECTAAVDKAVLEYVEEITKIDQLGPQEVEPYYRKLACDRLLLMVKMVERSNVIEHLCDMSTDEAKAFMWETKRHLFLMCLDGKENFPEFAPAFGNVLEKMRGLMQVMEILFQRYDAEEEELYDEIWNLREENARIRGAIRNLNVIKPRGNRHIGINGGIIKPSAIIKDN